MLFKRAKVQKNSKNITSFAEFISREMNFSSPAFGNLLIIRLTSNMAANIVYLIITSIFET